MEIHELMVVLGPTATGKTALSVRAARTLSAEIISADSRQVYRGLDIGTGKDLSEYGSNSDFVPYHLIDILDPGEAYNAFLFKQDTIAAINKIEKEKKLPLICGGTGLYIETLLLDYTFNASVRDKDFREIANKTSNEKLVEEIEKLDGELSREDKCNRHRLIRKLEVLTLPSTPKVHNPLTIGKLHAFGIEFPREIIRKRISQRLKERLENGMIDEVKGLMSSGASIEWLDALGLEYRYVSRFLRNEMNYETMFSLLETAIHQFAKRQTTWFRRMEKRGIKINWIDGLAPIDEKMEYILEIVDFTKKR